MIAIATLTTHGVSVATTHQVCNRYIRSARRRIERVKAFPFYTCFEGCKSAELCARMSRTCHYSVFRVAWIVLASLDFLGKSSDLALASQRTDLACSQCRNLCVVPSHTIFCSLSNNYGINS